MRIPDHQRWEPALLPTHLELVPAVSHRTPTHPAFPLDHAYVLDCWTGIAGPTAVLLLRRAAQEFLATRPPTRPIIDTAELAATLGIGRGVARDSVLARTIRRLGRFELAQWRPGGALAVTVLVPALSPW